jgi:hypothetical protein
MSKKKRTSLDAIFGEPVEDAPAPASRIMPATAGDGPKPRQEPAPQRTRLRTFEDRHWKQSAYLSDPVREQLRTLAYNERRKMHDYLMEGLELVFRKRGLPSIAELEKHLEKEDA